MSRAPRPQTDASLDLEDEGVDPTPSGPSPADWAKLIVRAAFRHRWITLAVFLAGALATTAYFVSKNPVYQVDTKLLMQRPPGPASVRSPYDDLPTKSAWELVHRRENLVALVRAAKILPEDEGGAAPARTPRKLGLAERLRTLVGREVTLGTEDPMDILVTVLDKRLSVATEDGTITISIIWPNPQQAYDVVNAALQNFLEARYIQEVRAMDEVISVVQGRAAAVRAEFEAASDEARRRSVRHSRAPSIARPRAPSEELARLQSLLEGKQRALADVEEFRRRRVADLQAQLDQARTTLSDAHPKVVGLRKDIESAARETPQLEALREEERAARKAYAAQLARENPGGAALASAQPAAIELPSGSQDEDPRVRQLRIQSEQMSMRVSAAQIELDAARAAFKYKYNIIWPPQLPTEPVSPNPKKIFTGGLLAALVLALLAGAAPDLLRGRILESWQVERQLGLPILGRIDE
jgi:uncharacterized protein involved in exopolysaccharide biosynthesis